MGGLGEEGKARTVGVPLGVEFDEVERVMLFHTVMHNGEVNDDVFGLEGGNVGKGVAIGRRKSLHSFDDAFSCQLGLKHLMMLPVDDFVVHHSVQITSPDTVEDGAGWS